MTLTEKLREQYAPGVAFTVPLEKRSFPDILFEVAGRYPERVAIDFLGQQTTYSQLVRQIRQAARALHRVGVRQGDRVGITLPNCTQHVVALYAIMTLGAIAVETNPLSPRSELTEALKRSGSEVLVVWENSLDQIDVEEVKPRAVFTVDMTKALPLGSRLLINLPIAAARKKKSQMSKKPPAWTRDWDTKVSKESPWRGQCPAKPDDVAVLLHTGGTTGTPKAVMITHQSMGTNTAQDVAWVPALHEGAEVFYAVLPFFHAFGLSVTLGAGFRLGGTQVIFPKFDVDMVLEAQKRIPCTFFLGVPPIFDRILKGLKTHPVDMSSIRFTLCGAMPIEKELADAWEEATGGLLVEGYGMTEASPIILGCPLGETRRRGALGIPFPSTEIRIVDPDNPDVDVPEGEVGELLARGPQVFKGYWENEEETKNAFHDGWLRTGDLVRLDDGFVVMADRRKELIISGGFNVYPSQVEEAVRTMPDVEDVAVVGVPGGSRGESVVAALILKSGATVTLDDVRRWAEKSIAHYALPRRIVVMSELPRSQLGKVMRRRVKEYLLNAGERLADSGDDLKKQLRASSASARQQIREGSAVAREQLRDLSEHLSEQVETTTQAAGERIQTIRRQIQNRADQEEDTATARTAEADGDDEANSPCHENDNDLPTAQNS
ncbi:MAG: AMP-binding protein [Actinomycetaceae bacterium]|nr:AMP-binding protein [Actinomycetaceae bacterium]